MSDEPLFQNADMQEEAYAPQQLPADRQGRLQADEGPTSGRGDPADPPDGGPVASVGSVPSSSATSLGMDPDEAPRDTEILGRESRGERET